MHLIAIGWLYVTILMAATEANFTSGILTFVLYGLAPMTVFFWLFGRRRRPPTVQADENESD